MGAWQDRIQCTPSEEAQVKGGRRNKGKKMNLKKIGFKPRLEIYLSERSEVRKSKRLKRLREQVAVDTATLWA